MPEWEGVCGGNTLVSKGLRQPWDLRGAGRLGAGDLVDDALDENDPDVDFAGDVGEEFGDEVVDRGRCEACNVTLRRRGTVGLNSGDIEVHDFGVDGEAKKRGAVGHSFPAVTSRPIDLGDGIQDSAWDGGVGHAVVARVLVNERGDQERVKELAGNVLGVGDADVLREALHAGPIGRVRVGTD